MFPKYPRQLFYIKYSFVKYAEGKPKDSDSIVDLHGAVTLKIDLFCLISTKIIFTSLSLEFDIPLCNFL